LERSAAARPSACENRESVLRTLRTRFGPERGSSAPAVRVGRERPEMAAFAGGLGTAANRLVHAAPRLRRGLPAQAMLRDAQGKGAGHRFAALRSALAAS
jgi:hypothetical protein